MLHSGRQERSRPAGFSLTEIIVVIAIIGAITAIAVPYMGQVMRRSRVEAAARQIYMPLLRARLESIKRGSNVLVEYSTNASKTSYQTAVVYLDSTTGTANAYDNTDTTVATFPTAPSSDSTILIDDADQASPATSSQTIEFIFTPFGSMDSANSTSKSIYIKDTSGNVVQIRVPTSTNGKAAMTKLLGSSYVSPPWKWY